MRALHRASAAAFLVGAVLAGSALPDDETLESLAAAAREESGAPALGCVLQRPGEEPRVVVTGVRVAGESAPVTTSDAWHWGSITKSMTATLVARLVEKESVSWDDRALDLVLDRAPDMNPGFAHATVRRWASCSGGS